MPTAAPQQQKFRKRILHKLTTKQQDILDFINSQYDPPTLAEIAAHFGQTPNAIKKHIHTLRIKGYLWPSEGGARDIKPIPMWYEIPECVIALAHDLHESRFLKTPMQVIALFESPEVYGDKWEEFSNEDGKSYRRLERKYRWRNN